MREREVIRKQAEVRESDGSGWREVRRKKENKEEIERERTGKERERKRQINH